MHIQRVIVITTVTRFFGDVIGLLLKVGLLIYSLLSHIPRNLSYTM